MWNADGWQLLVVLTLVTGIRRAEQEHEEEGEGEDISNVSGGPGEDFAQLRYGKFVIASAESVFSVLCTTRKRAISTIQYANLACVTHSSQWKQIAGNTF